MLREPRRTPGPVPLGEVLRAIPRGRGGIDPRVRGAIKQLLRDVLGEALAERTAVIEFTSERVVLGAGGPALVALQAAMPRVRRALAEANVSLTVVVRPAAGKPKPEAQLG